MSIRQRARTRLHRLALLGASVAALCPTHAWAAEELNGKDKGSVSARTDLFLNQLTFFERSYFIAGGRADQAKFQLSLKYNLWPNTTPHAVYVGYTQTSFWDIYEWSGPFTEFNFTPVLFYEYRIPRPQPQRSAEYCGPSFVRWALDHSSNGLVGTASRAFNRLSSTIATGCYSATGALFETRLQLWPPLIFDGENEDMEAYIGYGELTFNWASARSARGYGQVELSARFRKGASEDLRRGAVYLEAAWNPNYGAPVEGIWRFTPYLFAQFFTGYAESLSTYDIMHTRWRIGFGLNDILAEKH
ncbi:MAG TPA: phospholipase A [Polyangiaceae bacterium]|nr:phospholipase A [Polyangiaceae bacterium]